ncbi:MAG: MFS transporter [Pyrinomonadaceae bacterium]
MGQAKNSRFFYGWIIVAISTLSLVISNGLSIGGLPVFYKPIQEELLALGTVTAQTKDSVTGLGAGLTFLLAGISSLIIGLFIDRIGSRRAMIAGCLVLGGGLLFYSFADRPIDIYMSHSLLGLSLGLIGVMIQTVLISHWFRRRRGLAIGIVLTGTSFGGVIIPLIATPLIAAYGWRTSMQILSLIVWIVLLPAMIFIVKERASDLNLTYDGDILPADAKIDAANVLDGNTFAEALRSPIFWIIALCALLIFYPIFTISQQFILYLQNNLGVSKELASAAQSTLFFSSVAGKFLFGWLCDRFPVTTVIIVCCGIMFASTVMLLGFLTPSTIFVFLVPFGLGYGGTFVLIQLLTVESFGLRDIGKILGAITLIETLGGFLGSVITGRLASMSDGDYTSAFYGVAIAAGMALIMTFAMKLANAHRKSPSAHTTGL